MRTLFLTASALALLAAAPAVLAENLSTVEISGGGSGNEIDVDQETGNANRTQESTVTLQNNASDNTVDVDQLGNLGNATSTVTVGNLSGTIDPSGNRIAVLQETSRGVRSDVSVLGDGDDNEVEVLQRFNLGSAPTRTDSYVTIRGNSDLNAVTVEQVFNATVATLTEVDIRGGSRNDVVVRQADSAGPYAGVNLDRAQRSLVEIYQTDNNSSGVAATVDIGDGATASQRNTARVEQTGQNLAATADIDIVGSDNDVRVLQRTFTLSSSAAIDVTGDSNVLTGANGHSIEQAAVASSVASFVIEGSGNTGGIAQSDGNLLTATIEALAGSDGNALTVEQSGGGLFNTSVTSLYDSDNNSVAHAQTGGLGLYAETGLTTSHGNLVGVTQTGSGLLGGHNSLITLGDSNDNGVTVEQGGGGQDADTFLARSDRNTLTVAQGGTSNISYIDLTNAHDNAVGHGQTGVGALASTSIAASIHNTVAVTQAQ